MNYFNVRLTEEVTMKACADIFVSIMFTSVLGMALVILLLLSACTCSVVFSDADGEDAQNKVEISPKNDATLENKNALI